MKNPDFIFPNPASLAEPVALEVAFEPGPLGPNTEDSRRLVRLDREAEACDFTDQTYWVETSRALSIPVEYDKDSKVRILNFFHLDFEGSFICYSRVSVGKIYDLEDRSFSVNALCLTFNEPTLLPFMDTIPEDHLLYVPALAVDNIKQT